MLAAQRQAVILKQLRASGGVKVADLTRLLGVSDMTVRRDLDTLARQGLLDKVHGGATTPRHSSTEEPGFEAKSARERAEKRAIASAAAAMVQPGEAIGLSAGTTTWALAHELLGVPGLTFVTNSIHIAEVLYAGAQPDHTVVLTGGIRTPSDALVGPLAVSALRALNLDTVFLGVHGMDQRSGFTTPNLMEADTDRALVEAARRLIVVADHTKWGVVGISTVAALSDADVLVTDDGMEAAARTALEDEVGRLVVTRVAGRARPSPNRAAR